MRPFGAAVLLTIAAYLTFVIMSYVTMVHVLAFGIVAALLM